jgi:tol-pal system protein YbgF
MNKILTSLTNCFIFLIIFSFASHNLYGEEETTMAEQIFALQKDIKTLEKAVYSQNSERNDLNETISGSNDELNSDVLTKHLLKLSDLEDQFKVLTNNFEEINFKLDKLSSRITKVQSNNQMRFQDLETSGISTSNKSKKKKLLPGSGDATDLGGVSESDIAALEEVQQTQSVESVGTVITEEAEKNSKLLPDALPEKQYEFALSFLKVGDYETAEFALREFIDTNSKHKLAGNAQYWYGETFRVRQLYQDAATAYLDGYQKYPKSNKAPVNLLKLGVMLVKIGEKEQGCSMILGVKAEYPKANQSVIQKADYENKKFNCDKKSQ